jgi:thiol:disulfide interchange protein DsbC
MLGEIFLAKEISRMSRSIFSVLFLLLLLTLSACTVSPIKAGDPENDVTKSLLQHYPKIEYKEIIPAPIKGLYEVTITGGEIVYFDPESGYMFFGAIWTPDGRNLTQEKKDKRLAEQQILFPLDQAIKIGNGPNQVIEITDPDCPFCRRSDKYFSGRDDLTRYIFLHPLDKLHPHSAEKARYILGAADQAKAYEEVFSGKFDAQPVPETDDHGLLEIHRDVARNAGINGTPHSWINGEHVVGFNPQKFDELLSK